MSKILLIEDDQELAEVIKRELRFDKYIVTHIASGEIALEEFHKIKPDLLILDWMLPGLDGLAILREIRKESFVPVLMLTARRDEVDRVVGLELGADDYLTKPFGIHELLARVKALLRRIDHMRQVVETDLQQVKLLIIDDLTLNPQTFHAEYKKDPLDLTLIEFKTLYLLASNPGRAFTRRYLMDTIWEQDYYPGDRSVDNTILRLRKKLGSYATHIDTVRGMGYRYNK